MPTKKLLILSTAAVLAVAGAGVGGAAAAGAFGGDDVRVLPVTVGEPAPAGMSTERLTVEDGIARDRAVALATAATKRVPGQAISVEVEDGDHEVAVRNRQGRIVEVVLDGRDQVVSIDDDND